jgi:hypothetical protein
VGLKMPYVYDCITKLCRTQTQLIVNDVNPNTSGTGEGQARHRMYKKFKLGDGQAYGHSAD